MTSRPRASKNAFIAAKSSGELMSIETDVGKDSAWRLWLGLLAWVPVAVGDIEDEELGRDERERDWCKGCLQSDPVEATKLASLAAISSDGIMVKDQS